MVEQFGTGLPLVLPPFGLPDVAALAGHVALRIRDQEPAAFKGHDLLDALQASELYERISKIDPDVRPLYAAYCADALARGTDITNWRIDDVNAYVLKRERRRWGDVLEQRGPASQPADPAKWENLIALATAVRGLQTQMDGDAIGQWLEANAEPLARVLPPTDAPWIDIYRAMIGTFLSRDGRTEFLSQFEPDPVGEALVLDRLLALRTYSANCVKAFSTAAWTLDPFGLAQFLALLARDQSAKADPALVEALWGEAPTQPDAKVLRHLWSLAGSSLMEGFSAAGRFAVAGSIADRVEAVARGEYGDAAVRGLFASGLFGWFNYASADLRQALGLLARLQRLADAFPVDAEVGKVAWRGCGLAFITTAEHGQPDPGHLHRMAELLPRLEGDDEVKSGTHWLLKDLIVPQVLPNTAEPLRSQIEAAAERLAEAWVRTFGPPSA